MKRTGDDDDDTDIDDSDEEDEDEDHFTSNLDLENHLQFFVDTLEVLQQKGEAQSISQGMDHNMTNTMNRLIQTHGRLQQFIANNNSGF